ncbi:MerR family transcriptional regulator [Kineococcus sp. NUM-3379]
MRISELSARSGVSAASIKYYVREGLLPPGQRTGYNQTDYTDRHLERLRLIRSLIDVGGLPVTAVARVLAAVDDPDLPLQEVLGAAQQALPQALTPPSPRAVARVAELVADRGWRVHDDNPGLRAVASVLDSYTRLGREDLAATLPRYAEAAALVAEADLDAVAAPASAARGAAAETVVVGTVLGDQLLAGLRRIAQEDASTRRYSRTGGNP